LTITGSAANGVWLNPGTTVKLVDEVDWGDVCHRESTQFTGVRPCPVAAITAQVVPRTSATVATSTVAFRMEGLLPAGSSAR
jgi:hypothetical protein